MIAVSKPTLVVDKQKAINNIRRLVKKAEKHNLTLRPHFKTHQAHEVGRWFRHEGVHSITVSTMDMAEHFAADGWKDITIAFPVNILEIESINKLASQINLNILIENLDIAKCIESKLKHEVGVYIKTNTGYNRAGIKPDNYPLMDDILQVIDSCEQMNFLGFLVHSGHTYNAVNKQEILNIHEKCLLELSQLKAYYIQKYPDLQISLGDTPACSLADNFTGVDEIRPGNFVFYDAMQFNLGSCSINDVAIIMAAPVVSKYKDRNEVLVYCGADHLSKDFIETEKHKTFGYLARFKNQSWEIIDTSNYMKSISQFHGVLKLSDEVLDTVNVGDLIGIIPVHSCLTVNIMKYYKTLDGKVIEAMPPVKP